MAESTQALPGGKFETLKNMNASSQKFATWVVRVIQGRVISYTFTSRGETVNASKFVCILVSDNASEYMHGLCPFSFANPKAAEAAAKKFQDGTCWEITTPAFEASQKVQYNSCPVKTCLKLAAPTGLQAVRPVDTEKYNYAVKSIHPAMTLAQALTILNSHVQFQATPMRGGTSGSANATSSKLVDLSFKIRTRSEKRTVAKNGNSRTVVNLHVVDDSITTDGKQAGVEIGVWDKAIASVPAEGTGCCVVGCTVTRESNECKINIWDSALWVLTGDRAQSLTGLQAATNEEDIATLTAEFKPTAKPVDISGAALPTCAVRLAAVEDDVLVEGQDLTFQINRVFIETSASSTEDMHSKSGHLLIVRVILWDWTGQVEADVLEEAVPALFGFSTKQDVEDKLAQPELGSLQIEPTRRNVRGVVRLQQGVVKKLIASVTPSPVNARISSDALVTIRGLSDSMDSVVVVAPADRVCDCPLLGMAVESDTGMMQPAHRIVMLLTSTETSQLNALPPKPGSASNAFFVESDNVECELSNRAHGTVSLRGYCGFHNMLEFRLADGDTAIVIVSAVAGPPVPRSGPLVLTIEHIQKVGTANMKAVLEAMKTEWTVAFGKPMFTTAPVTNIEYWNSSNAMRKLKRIISEPTTPEKKPTVAT